ncbi:MAG: hypothetical protein ACFBWO_10045 [Paracoccaceae bacterium]
MVEPVPLPLLRQRHDAETGAFHAAAWAMLVFTVFAFAQKVVVVPERLDRYTPLVVAHAGAMLAWLSLFTWQAWLVRHDAVRLHKGTGALSVVVVVAVLATGFLVSARFTVEFDRIQIFLGNTVQLGSFALLWLAGVVAAATHRIAAHRRLMFLAAFATLTPPISRVTQTLGLPNAAAAMIHAGLIFALPIAYDLVQRGRPHPASVLALAVISALLVVAIVLGTLPPLPERVMALLARV